MEFSQLLLQAQQGDATRLDDLLSDWRPWLRIQAKRLECSPTAVRFDASDLVQMTMVEAYQRLHEFRGVSPGEFGRWLLRILQRQSARQHRFHAAYCREIHRDCHGSWSVDDSELSPSRELIHVERRERLSLALEQLPERLRNVVVARVFHGQSFQSLAESLQVSPRVIRRQWTEAIRQLGIAMQGLSSSHA